MPHKGYPPDQGPANAGPFHARTDTSSLRGGVAQWQSGGFQPRAGAGSIPAAPANDLDVHDCQEAANGQTSAISGTPATMTKIDSGSPSRA